MASYVIDLFENDNMLYKYQFGFRKKNTLQATPLLL